MWKWFFALLVSVCVEVFLRLRQGYVAGDGVTAPEADRGSGVFSSATFLFALSGGTAYEFPKHPLAHVAVFGLLSSVATVLIKLALNLLNSHGRITQRMMNSCYRICHSLLYVGTCVVMFVVLLHVDELILLLDDAASKEWSYFLLQWLLSVVNWLLAVFLFYCQISVLLYVFFPPVPRPVLPVRDN